MKANITTKTAMNTAELVEALERHGVFDIPDHAEATAAYRRELISEWDSPTRCGRKAHKDAAAMLTGIFETAETLEAADWMMEVVAHQINRYSGGTFVPVLSDIGTDKLARFAAETRCFLMNISWLRPLTPLTK